jgi:3-phosphoshikimate 1-carboxyvinyltransferase
VAFAELLERMGCLVSDDAAGVTIARDPSSALRGLDVDMAPMSDLVPTVAVVAATATTATTIRGVGFIRSKESDRLGDLATELTKTGALVTVEPDGLRIDPAGSLHGAVLGTHHDHRLAMAFGVLATAVAGIEVADPGVVSKSWPDFWHVRDEILRQG